MFVTNWISTTKIQKISEITNFFRHYFLSRTEVYTSTNCYGKNPILKTNLFIHDFFLFCQWIQNWQLTFYYLTAKIKKRRILLVVHSRFQNLHFLVLLNEQYWGLYRNENTSPFAIWTPLLKCNYLIIVTERVCHPFQWAFSVVMFNGSPRML